MSQRRQSEIAHAESLIATFEKYLAEGTDSQGRPLYDERRSSIELLLKDTRCRLAEFKKRSET